MKEILCSPFHHLINSSSDMSIRLIILVIALVTWTKLIYVTVVVFYETFQLLYSYSIYYHFCYCYRYSNKLLNSPSSTFIFNSQFLGSSPFKSVFGELMLFNSQYCPRSMHLCMFISMPRLHTCCPATESLSSNRNTRWRLFSQYAGV